LTAGGNSQYDEIPDVIPTPHQKTCCELIWIISGWIK
jgi:hypothetical protein